MSRWWAVVSAAALAFVALSAPAQAGPLPAVVSVPLPDDLPTGDGNLGGIVSEVRSQVQAFVKEQVGNEPNKTKDDLLKFVDKLKQRVQKTGECVKPDFMISPDGELTEPKVTADESDGSLVIKVDAGALFMRILVKDCIDDVGQSQSGPDP